MVIRDMWWGSWMVCGPDDTRLKGMENLYGKNGGE